MAPASAVASVRSSWKSPVSRRWALPAAIAVLALASFLVLVPAAGALAAAPPTIASVAPSSGPVDGGTSVIITGTGFTGLAGGSAVTFGGTDAAAYTVDSDTQITAVTPAHGAGSVELQVTAEGGSVSADFAFLTRYDHKDSHFIYSGTWADFSTASAWKGSYRRSSTAAASVSVTFDGTRLDWIAMKGTTTGIADVYLDNALIKTVDLTSATPAYQQDVWSTGDIGAGVHTVKIVRSSSSASGKYLTIDAVDVQGTLLKPGRIQQTDARLAYAGSWATFSTTGASGASYTRASTGGASVSVDFNGTYLAWIATKGTTLGRAWVSLDGGAAQNVDLSSTTVAYQQTVWNTGHLPVGDHEVRIWWDSTNDPGKFISVDAFDLEGSLKQAYPLNRYEEDAPRLAYTGTWTSISAAEASKGSYKRANTSAATVSVTFTGIRLDWIATTGPGMGVAVVSVDDGPAQSVDLSGPTMLYQQNVWSTGKLAAGVHRVEIAWDEGNAAGAVIGLDAIDVLGTLPAPGSFTTAEIKWVEQKLTDLSYRPGTIDGVIDAKTKGAIIAFQKWEGLTRDGNLSATVWNRLQTASRPKPTKSGATATWIEVNKTKQVLLYCKNGAVVWTLPVSTGSASVGIVTPSGTFSVTRKTLETDPRYLPLYISTTLLAIHGYPNVPTYAASHGCVRTQLWDQDALQPLIPVGTPVYIY